MSLFDRLFRSDPRQLLARAEGLLGKGDAEGALRAALRARKIRSGTAVGEAEELVARARRALVEEHLSRAARSEAEGFPADAAEWTELALEHVEDAGRRAELARRAGELRERADQAPTAAASLLGRDPDQASTSDEGGEMTAEDHYQMLIGTLDEDVAPRYEERPEAFVRAYLELNEGRAREALPTLEELAAADADDPVYRFERGRCRLLLGDLAGARRDLEAVWRTFGDEPLDLAGRLSVPGLWAEVMLGLDQPRALVERLDGVADPAAGDPTLCAHYGEGLTRCGRLDDAQLFLRRCIDHFGGDPEFPLLLAAVEHQGGRADAAVATLEQAIAPSCAGGGCHRPAPHAPSLRALIELHLAAGRAGRVEELFAHLARSQGGALAAPDYLLLAGLRRLQGDDEGATEAAAEARRLGAG